MRLDNLSFAAERVMVDNKAVNVLFGKAARHFDIEFILELIGNQLCATFKITRLNAAAATLLIHAARNKLKGIVADKFVCKKFFVRHGDNLLLSVKTDCNTCAIKCLAVRDCLAVELVNVRLPFVIGIFVQTG